MVGELEGLVLGECFDHNLDVSDVTVLKVLPIAHTVAITEDRDHFSTGGSSWPRRSLVMATLDRLVQSFHDILDMMVAKKVSENRKRKWKKTGSKMQIEKGEDSQKKPEEREKECTQRAFSSKSSKIDN